MSALLQNIPISEIKTCVYNDWYKFKTCEVKTCKNHTEITTSKCLAIDRVQPVGNKIISDSELHLFKFSKDKVSTRFISIKRKNAVTRVKAILILNAYLEHIRSECRTEDQIQFESKLIEKIEKEYPLRIKKLGYQNWMLKHLIDKKAYSKFAKKRGGECTQFKLNTLLNLTNMKFAALESTVNVALRSKNQSDRNLNNHNKEQYHEHSKRQASNHHAG